MNSAAADTGVAVPGTWSWSWSWTWAGLDLVVVQMCGYAVCDEASGGWRQGYVAVVVLGGNSNKAMRLLMFEQVLRNTWA